MITFLGTFPVTMNPAIETLSPPRTRARVEILPRREPALSDPDSEVKETPGGTLKARELVFAKSADEFPCLARV